MTTTSLLPEPLYRNPRLAWAAYAALGALLVILPFAVDSAMGRTWVRILDFAMLYAMLALGLNIVVGFAGLLDLGYVAFYAVGAYFYAILASPQFDIHLPFWVLLPLGSGLACIFGVLLGAPTLRLRGDYLAIVTLGFGEIIRIFLNNLNDPINITNGPQGINAVDPVQLAGHSLTRTIELFGVKLSGAHAHYYLFLILTLAAIFVAMRLQQSRIGRAWAAIREDEVAAAAMGIDTRNIKLLAFAMGAAFGGLGGGLFASFQGFVSPESFTLMESIMILCMVVLGGMGHIPGVVLGAVLVTVLPELLRYIGPAQKELIGRVVVDPADLRMLLFGVALVVVMLFRPQGLWPSPVRARELHPENPDEIRQEQESLYDAER
jgi:branched-chain amino acid transport system permease protein